MTPSSIRWPSLAIVLVFAAGVAATVPTLPAVGDPRTPPHQHLAQYYLATAPGETGISNVVTAILAAYRGFDTFGEVVVVFVAGIGLLLVLQKETITESIANARTQRDGSRTGVSEVVRAGLRLVAPFIATLGLFVAFHGADSAGGGFQGGVIAAAAVILLVLSSSPEETKRWLNETVFVSITIGGVLMFALIGLGAIGLGSQFLDYRAYPLAKAMVYGIETVEVAIGATVIGIVLVYVFGLMPTWKDRERVTSSPEEESR